MLFSVSLFGFKAEQLKWYPVPLLMRTITTLTWIHSLAHTQWHCELPSVSVLAHCSTALWHVCKFKYAHVLAQLSIVFTHLSGLVFLLTYPSTLLYLCFFSLFLRLVCHQKFFCQAFGRLNNFGFIDSLLREGGQSILLKAFLGVVLKGWEDEIRCPWLAGISPASQAVKRDFLLCHYFFFFISFCSF